MDSVEELKNHIQSEREKKHQSRLEIDKHPDLNVRQIRIIQHVMAHPHDILTIKIHQNINSIVYQTARTDLLDLEEKKWLKSVKKGKTFYFIPSDHFSEKIKE
jgi:Fic family protein